MLRIQQITASVRTTNRMNALLSESMLSKRKAMIKSMPADNEDENEAEFVNGKPKNELKYFSKNFSMEKIYKLIESTIEDRLTWDRFSRSYDSWRSLQMAEGMATEIRDRIKKFNYKRHRIVCFITIIERQNQGISYAMRYLMDEKLDNFTKIVYERPTYYIVVTLFLVHKD